VSEGDPEQISTRLSGFWRRVATAGSELAAIQQTLLASRPT